MEEKEFINKINGLKKIEPSQDWVLRTKNRILGAEQKPGFISVLEFLPRMVFKYNKLAFAVVIIFGFVTGSFSFAQNSLPGDPVYILKKITEKTRMVLASEQDVPTVQLEFVNKRLEELKVIAKTNQVKKIAPALEEFQTNISKAAEELVRAENLNVREIVSETKKIKESRQEIEEVLGVMVGDTKDLDEAFLQLIERQLKDLEMSTLTEDQKNIFTEAASNFQKGNYVEAWEGILMISHPQ